MEYCVSENDADIPKLTGLNVFLKELAAIKIDKNLIENTRVLAILSRNQDTEHNSEYESDVD